MLNLPSLLDFYFARAVQVPLSLLLLKSAETLVDTAFPLSFCPLIFLDTVGYNFFMRKLRRFYAL